MICCVGIDLAWSPRNSSGGFVLEADGSGTAHVVNWHDSLQDDDEIVAFVAQACDRGAALVAVDAPLAVPNACGARPCDREITRVFGRFQAGAHPANRQTLARYGGLRGERLAQRIVKELDFAHSPYIMPRAAVRQLIEVYPHPGMVALFELKTTLKYKRGQVSQRRCELGRLERYLLDLADKTPTLQLGGGWRREIKGLRGRRLKQYEDLLDSLFCAYVAVYCWHHGPSHYHVFGNVREGHIVVPIPPGQRSRFGVMKITREAVGSRLSQQKDASDDHYDAA